MKLRELRHLRALSMQELAEKAKVAISTIANIEKGTAKPRRFETVRKLAAALHVHPQSVDEFQELVGKPRFGREDIPVEVWAQVTAELDAMHKEEIVSDDEFWRLVEQEQTKQESNPVRVAS